MKDGFSIRLISAAQTHQVRHPMLRKGRPISDCEFYGDYHSNTLHLGAFEKEQLVGVLSAYEQNNPYFKTNRSYQVRGVAVLPSHHRQGIGKDLMHKIEYHLEEQKVDLIWLNARINAVYFYRALHYSQKGSAFEISGIGTHYCFYKYLTNED